MTRTPAIVYATDFSPASIPAFRAAVEEARRRRTELLVAHVAAVPIRAIEGGLRRGRRYDALLEPIGRETEQRLGRLVRQAGDRGVRARALMLQGIPFEAIVAAARRHRAQLVVLGTHGRTGVPRLILGSVAARVVGLAPCPVLTVRAGSHRAPRAA